MTDSNRIDVHEVIKQPFIRWYVDMAEWGAEIKGDGDIVLSSLCAGRYALKIDDDHALALGIPDKPAVDDPSEVTEIDMFSAVPWTSAEMLKNFRKSNYLKLTADNANISGSEEILRLRVYFPIEGDKMDALYASDPRPSKLRLRPMRIKKGKPLLSIGQGRLELPLTFSVK